MEDLINLNGKIISANKNQLSFNNRAFKYGDSLFETLKVIDSNIVFLEDHYFRLMASMRMLRMEIPMDFDMCFFESEIKKCVSSNSITSARCRLSVWRAGGGRYNPDSNKIEYLVEIQPLLVEVKETYTIDLFRDYFINSGLLSTLKTTNRITNVLAGIYADENGFDNCLLLNERKQVVETINGNIFVVKGNKVITPPVSDGCVKGILRKKLLEIISKEQQYELEEVSISPFDLQKADELFMTNSIIGIQPITQYKKKIYSKKVSLELTEKLSHLV